MEPERYAVELTAQAEKDLKRLRPWVKEATHALLTLETDPTRGHELTGSLRGTRSLEFSLKGSGAQRAVYLISEDERLCLVFIIGPHENIYAKAMRRVAAARRRAR